MLAIISHTPAWVFAVFFTLLILGMLQTRQRVVKLKTVFILPVAMIIFSFFGVFSAFGMTLLTMTLWIIGLVLMLLIGLQLAYPKSVTFSAVDNKLIIPGSWVPLSLMMAIFLTKYFVGFAIARQLSVIEDITFICLISFLYGVFSGAFLSRSLVMFKASKLAS